jgi:ABC-type antimicrobial peptide transport system permease subunit
MTGYVSDLLSPNTFALTLFALFAALAFVMATVGIYGTLSHAVGARTKEIGIRMALGSEQRGVARLVVGQGLRLTAIGVGVGMVASLWLSRFVASLLYGVTPTDPATFAVIAVSVVLVGAAASYVPARRAAAVDPAEALRGD